MLNDLEDKTLIRFIYVHREKAEQLQVQLNKGGIRTFLNGIFRGTWILNAAAQCQKGP